MNSYIPIAPIQALVSLLKKDLDSIDAQLWHDVAEKLQKYQVDDPDYSIIMIARNEERYLFASLASMADMDLNGKKVELLFVNNGSTDRTREIAERLGVTIIDEHEPGWGEAREAGLLKAKGRLILSADSDNLYPSTWLREISRPLEEHNEVQVTYGQYCFYTYDNRYPLSVILYQHIRFFNSWLRSFKKGHLNAMGGNMAFRRKEALSIGGFRHGIGRGEDGDLAYRLSDFGTTVFLSHKEALTYSSLRNVVTEGTLVKTFLNKIWTHIKRFPEYLVPHKPTN